MKKERILLVYLDCVFEIAYLCSRFKGKSVDIQLFYQETEEKDFCGSEKEQEILFSDSINQNRDA